MKKDNYKGDPILKELWEEKADNERTGNYDDFKTADDVNADTHTHEVKQHKKAKESDNRAIRLYQSIKSVADTEPELKKMLDEVNKHIGEYASAVARTNQGSVLKSGGELDKESIMRYDQTRRNAHNALIDSVNILSRAFRRHELDNSWRGGVGLEREELGRWACAVADAIIDKEVPREPEVA